LGQPGRASRHNLKYWRREPYLGFGAGAHSFNGVTRWANAHDSAQYVAVIQSGSLPAEQIRIRLQAGRLSKNKCFSASASSRASISISSNLFMLLAKRELSSLHAGLIERTETIGRLALGKTQYFDRSFRGASWLENFLSRQSKNVHHQPANIVDLRSDTVTRPLPLCAAPWPKPKSDDVYLEDPSVNRLEKRAAEIFAKEAALFVPTGCMSNLHSPSSLDASRRRSHLRKKKRQPRQSYETRLDVRDSGCIAAHRPRRRRHPHLAKIEAVIRPRIYYDSQTGSSA